MYRINFFEIPLERNRNWKRIVWGLVYCCACWWCVWSCRTFTLWCCYSYADSKISGCDIRCRSILGPEP